MDAAAATIICATITALGTIAVAKVGSRSKADNREIMDRLARLEQRQIQGELESCRNDLIQSLKLDPQNLGVIMEIAKRYFLDLNGNSYASKPFALWALTYRVDIRRFYTEHNDLEFYINNPEITMRE